MDARLFKRLIRSQFDAAFSMLEECIRICPRAKWRGRVANYEFWHVAYHALYCTDLFTARAEAQWRTSPRFHPGGRVDVEDEYPSRVMLQAELAAYLASCRRKVRASLARESAASLRGPSGFEWLPMSRAELLVYSLRHLQHHAGQLSAFLRRAGKAPQWRKAGAGTRAPVRRPARR